MKRIRNLVIGGIENKVFNLILITVILLTGAFIAVSSYQSRALSGLAARSSEKQQAAIDEITGEVMGSVVEQSLTRTTALQAYIADEMFRSLAGRVEMLAGYAQRVFSDPDAFPRMPVSAPDPARDGEVVPQLILAGDADASDPDLADRLGLAANLSEMMVSLFGASAQTNSLFIALPEGAFLVTDDRSASKMDASGAPVPYDPRTRPWYIQALEAGKLIFTDVEVDAFTGDIGIVCAMPVYLDGRLTAVVGSDLFLTSMQAYVESAVSTGSYIAVINGSGHVVFSPASGGSFQVMPTGQSHDLREDGNAALAAFVAEAMQGKTPVRTVELAEGLSDLVGVPMPTVGWTVVAVCSREATQQPAAMLRASYARIQDEASASYHESTGHSRTTAIVLLVVIACLMLAGALILGKRIVRPLNTITRRISELSETNLEFKMEDTFRTGDEVEELAESFAAVSHRTVEYLDTIRQVTAEKERIGAELSLATQIQAAMLPHIVPAFPDRRDFDIIGTMDPAKEVGGDFYDYFLIDDDHLGMVIADVSGKGVPAALFMMASKIILQSVAMLGGTPGQILTRTNEAICSSNEAEMFVTVWVGILELSTGRLTAANAGHEYPAIKRPGGAFELYKDRHGLVIGGMEGAKYQEYELTLEPGTKLFVYTDGVPEATSESLELFGTDRMLAALNTNPDGAPIDILRSVRKGVDSFVLSAEQFDDLTMLCLEYKGPDVPREET